MKQRGWPLWLLRDVGAFVSVLFSFFTLVIFTIASEGAALLRPEVRKKVHQLLARAEAHLNHAFWREAYRRLGWNPRDVAFTPVAPPTDADGLARFTAYADAFANMETCVRAYVDQLRRQYRIARSALASHGSTDARLRRAAHHERVSVAALLSQQTPLALILSSALRARPSKDACGVAQARGPPRSTLVQNQKPTSQAPPARTHPHARKQKPRRAGPSGVLVSTVQR